MLCSIKLGEKQQTNKQTNNRKKTRSRYWGFSIDVTRPRRQQEHKKAIGQYAKQQPCMYITRFRHFLNRCATTTSWNVLISPFTLRGRLKHSDECLFICFFLYQLKGDPWELDFTRICQHFKNGRMGVKIARWILQERIWFIYKGRFRNNHLCEAMNFLCKNTQLTLEKLLPL